MLTQVFYFFLSGFDLNLLALNIFVVSWVIRFFAFWFPGYHTTLLGESNDFLMSPPTHADESPFCRDDLGDLAVQNKQKRLRIGFSHDIVSRHYLR